MADKHHVIEVILRGRDDLSDNLRRATGNLEEFKRETKESERDFHQSTESFKKDLADRSRSWEQSQRDIERATKGNVNALKNLAQAERELENASKRLAAAERDRNTSGAQGMEKYRQAQMDLASAQVDYNRVLRDEAKVRGDVARNRAQEAADLRTSSARYEEVAKASNRATKAKEDYVRASKPQDIERSRQAIDREAASIGNLTGNMQKAVHERDRMYDTARAERHARAQEGVNNKFRQYVRHVEEAQRAHAKLNKTQSETQKVKLEIDKRQALASAGALKAELQGLLRHIEVNADLDAGSFMAEASKFEAMKAVLSKDIDINVDLDTGKARAQMAALNRSANSTKFSFGGLFGAIHEGFNNSASRIAAFDNLLRGAAALGVVFFFQQIIVWAGAAGGALLALGSSALYAGGALAGGLTAGIAQAIPVIGIFAAALQQASGAMKAVQQSNLMQQQEGAKAVRGAKQQANAADTLANAQDSLRDAHERVADAQERVGIAQERLTEARKEARRDLQDLIAAEREAELAAKGATLSQQEAADALRESIRTGQVSKLPRQELAIQETRFASSEARRRLSRSREDLGTARAQGSPAVRDATRGVQEAKESVRDAEQQVVRAERAMVRARRSTVEVGAETGAAAGKLNYLLANMSGAQRRLYEALKRLQETWKDVGARITEPLINHFTRVANRLTTLLNNRRYIAAARSLAGSMAKELNRMLDFATSSATMERWLKIMQQARTNMRPLANIAMSLGRAFQNIAIAAGPALHDIIKWIESLTDRFRKFTDSTQGRNQLASFFSEGVRHIKAWAGLLGAVARLFWSIASPGGGAKAGIDLLTQFTDKINGWADAISTKGSKANTFFRQLWRIMRIAFDALGPIFTSIGEQLMRIFGEESKSGGASIKAFSKIVADVLIPALGDLIILLGKAVRFIGEFVDEHPGIAKLAAQFISIALFMSVFMRASAFLAPLVKTFGYMYTHLLKNTGAMRALSGVVRSIGFTAVNAFGKFASSLTHAVGGALGRLRLTDRFKSVFGRLGIGAGGEAGNGIINRTGARVREGLGRLRSGLSSVFNRVFGGIGRGAGNSAAEGIVHTTGAGVDAKKGRLSGVGKRMGGFILGGLTAALAIGIPLLAEWIANELNKKIRVRPQPSGRKTFSDDQSFWERTFGNIPMPFRQTGGPIGSGYGGGDRVPVLAEAGEWVIRKEAVRSWGDAFMSFINSGGGQFGGTSRDGRRFQEGGRVKGRGGGADAGDLVISVAGEERLIESYSKLWEKLADISQRGRGRIEADFRRLHRVSDRYFDLINKSGRENFTRLFSVVTNRVDRMQKSVNEDFGRMVRGVRRSMGSVMNAVYTGMDYIGDSANSALKAYDVDPVRLNIPKPKGLGRAVGGFIGNRGERGKDKVLTYLGRGEAVLNHWQQSAVQAMLPAGVTLEQILGRTRGYHAGGPEQPGFAGGRAPGIELLNGASDAVRSIANWAHQKYGAEVTSGYTDRTSGTTFHAGRKAADLVSPNMLDLARGISSRFGSRLLELIHTPLGYSIDNGKRVAAFAQSTHYDHVHVAAAGKALAAGAGEMFGKIMRVLVKGKGGVFGKLSQKILDKVRKAAQSYVDNSMPTIAGDQGEMTSHPTGRGALSRSAVIRVINEAMDLVRIPDSLRNAWRSMAYARAGQESGFNPNARNNWDSNAAKGIPSQGLFQTIPPTFTSYMMRGHGNILNPLDNAIAAFRYMLARYGNGSWETAHQRMLGRAGVGYATGGIIPGDREGAPQPILAHAGEWVVNRLQQSKLASLLGTTTDRIKSFLGFSGGPFSFAGGGEIVDQYRRRDILRSGAYKDPFLDPDTLGGVMGEINLAMNATRNLKRSAKKFFDKFTDNIDQIANEENGLLKQASDEIERLSARLERRLKRSTILLGRHGQVIGKLNEASVDERTLRNLITVGNATRRVLQRTSATLNRVNREIESIERGGVTKGEGERYKELRGYRRRLEDAYIKFDSELAENMAARLEKQKERIARAVERAGVGVENAERNKRLVDAMGLGKTGEGINAQELVLQRMKEQQTAILKQAGKARKQGMGDYARELEKSADDLNASIQEYANGIFQVRIDAVNERYGRINAEIGFRERVADVLGRGYNALTGVFGADPVGAAQQKAALLAQTGASQAGQLGELRALRAQTQNLEVQQSLDAQIRELETAVVENTLAQRDATSAVRQAQIEAIHQRQQFRGGLFGGLQGLVQLVGQVTGGDTTGQQLGFLNQSGAQLGQTGAGLRQRLFEWSGIDLRNLTGLDFANAFQGAMASFDGIMANLTEQERQNFEGLINSILENENALWQNTQAIKELAHPQAQQFSTTAWQWFRRALMTGMGDFLPQYDIPQLQTGGIVTKGGAVLLHAGEVVTNPNRGQFAPSGVSVTVNEAEPSDDPVYMANRIGWVLDGKFADMRRASPSR